MEKLTIDQLRAMQPGKIFATGVIPDGPDGVNMTNSGKELRWVACRGGIHDWAIYIHWSENSAEWVKDNGDKVHGEHYIRKLVPCDNEAFGMYRH